jgi:hypothetical protein
MAGKPGYSGVQASDIEIRQFLKFWNEGQGMSIAKSAKAVGRSQSWGKRQVKEYREKGGFIIHGDSSEPRQLSDLDGGVKDTLKDFSLFRKTFLCRDESLWAKDAADRIVERLLDKEQKDYVVINTPPGVGKTTLFTHDIPVWLICGGGSLDPAFGRALRILLGSKTKNVATHYVERLRRLLETRRPYYDKQSKRRAEISLIDSFGRFRPKTTEGEDYVWRRDQFTVAQLEDIDLYEKEPTVQAASRESGFLGERVDFYSWDDLAVRENSFNADLSAALGNWFEDEAETRLEPGGVGLLVGQRLSSIDLYRNRLDAIWTDETGEEHKRYDRIVYPAHFDEGCDGRHRQWDGESGCVLDETRLPWRELERVASKGNYRTVYLQEDHNYENQLVLPVWILGGTDPYGYEAPGCMDRDRGFYNWFPGQSVDYVTVDPSAGNFWACEWWSLNVKTGIRSLVWGHRKRMQAGDFLDWNPKELVHVGLMEDLQTKSVSAFGHPIRCWIIEANAAHRYLFQYEHYRSWRKRWPLVDVISHVTQKNKADPELGVEATLPMGYRMGMKRLPGKHAESATDMAQVSYVRQKVKELTEYPYGSTDDTVMADWFGEYNLENIKRIGAKFEHWGKRTEPPNLPPYLKRQYEEVAV